MTHTHPQPAGRVAVSGSIATDYLMTFPGRFADQLIADQLDKVSLSFLAEDLEIRRGGAAANISFGLGVLGLSPILIGAVGPDFGEYELWLKEHGVDTSCVLVSETRQTARFMCTTDLAMNQIASFYAGAMAEAGRIGLADVFARTGVPRLVVVSPNEPEAMTLHTAQSRELGIPFAADPSQQLARLDREQVRRLVAGAAYLFTNEYEAELLAEHSGWTHGQVLEQVGEWVITVAEKGARVERAGADDLEVNAVPVSEVVDPTGAGDAFRAGFLAARGWGLTSQRAAQLGCAMASAAVESSGCQEYGAGPRELLGRIRTGYGDDVAAGFAPLLIRP